jgi:large subunit ribosomal protein L25
MAALRSAARPVAKYPQGPAHVEVDISGREAGQHVLASDLVLPANVELLTDPSLLVVHLAEPTVAAEEGEEGTEADAAE